MKKSPFMMVLILCFPLFASAAPADGAPGEPTDHARVSGLDTEGEEESALPAEGVSDPLEPLNRLFFRFNDLFYFGLLQPVATVYAAIAPEPLRVGVKNVFHNLATPTYVTSALLQGKVAQSGVELGRFGINTTLGLLGFIDVAKEYGMEGVHDDLGVALGHYGAGDTLYLVWPILGPSNLRDSIGLVGETLLNPLTYVPKETLYRAGLTAYRITNTASLHLGEYENLTKSAIDPYVALRDGYLQRRRISIKE